MQNNLAIDLFLGGDLKIYQDSVGYKSGTDAVLLASIIEAKKNYKVLDLGAGVGVASFCLASRIKDIEVYGLEINQYFYEIFLKNKEENKHIKSLVIPVLGDILKRNIFEFKLDIIMANPPYYKFYEGDLHEQHDLKKQGNVEGKAKLEDFIKFAFYNLKNNGYFYIIHRSERIKEVLDLLPSKHWGGIEINPIYSYQGKDAKRFIIKAKKSSKTPSRLKYGIVIHNVDGSYTKEADNILRKGMSFY